jgi:tetratricopeptide (TPR) repeat protein
VCLEVFVNPGVQETFNTAQIPRPYAVAFWPHYLAQVVSALHERPFSQDKISILDLQHRFMTNEHILRAWCCDTTWSTCSLATVKNIATLAGRVGNQELETLSREFQDWILICKTNPTEVFLPAAKVYAEEGLHGDAWIPITAIEAIAQIKALIENGDTLDMDIDKLSQPLPLTTIMEAVHWAGLEETPTWHRKLGVCLRTCDYMAEAMEHFEMALELNLSLLLARSGLAILYEGQAFHEKAIELELANATALSLSEQYQHQTATGDSDSVELRRELCTSYEFIARNYETLKDFAHALQFWRKAFDTKEVHHWWFVTYLHRLATSSASAPTPKEDQDRWTEIMHLLKEAEKRPGPGFDNDNNNISFLTHCIMQNPQPGDSISAEGFQPNFFAVIATAAQNTGSTDWLENAYKMAIRSSKSHVLSIVLKYCVIKMLKSWADHDQWKKAEPYIEDIAAIATLARAGTGDGPRSEALDLHRCSVQIARDFGLICVRRVLESDMDVEVVKHYCQKLERFSGAGVATLGAWSEDNFQADIYIYIEPCSSV